MLSLVFLRHSFSRVITYSLIIIFGVLPVFRYYCGSWQAAQWFVIGMLLLVLLFMYTCTQPFRFMKPLPFISIDWLGLALWSAFLLELI